VWHNFSCRPVRLCLPSILGRVCALPLLHPTLFLLPWLSSPAGRLSLIPDFVRRTPPNLVSAFLSKLYLVYCRFLGLTQSNYAASNHGKFCFFSSQCLLSFFLGGGVVFTLLVDVASTFFGPLRHLCVTGVLAWLRIGYIFHSQNAFIYT
jgi:hypothetical protein